jgi:hypothetical protein
MRCPTPVLGEVHAQVEVDIADKCDLHAEFSDRG